MTSTDLRARVIRLFVVVLASGGVSMSFAQTGVSFLDPTDGWLYSYQGNFTGSVDEVGMPPGFGTGGQQSLDGTYRHDQGDKWDGTAPGAPLSDPTAPSGPASTADGGPLGTSPGGAGVFFDGDRDYLRIQDAGNPELHGWVQANNPANTNRRVYFGHDMTQEDVLGNDQEYLDNGVTVSFRMRIPNSGPLDDIYTEDVDGNPVVLPWLPPDDPQRLRGFPIVNEGRGMITLVQNDVFDDFGDVVNKDSGIAFSLISAADIADLGTLAPGSLYTTGSGSGGLVMNNLNGNTANGNVDFESSGTLNLLEIPEEELGDWHEFWITIEDNGGASGTHRVKIYMDGQVDEQGDPAFNEFNVTATSSGNTSYANEQSAFLEFGVNDNGLFGAFDLDFIAYKLGIHEPVVAVLFDEADFDKNGAVDGDDFLIWQSGFGTLGGATQDNGDANGDGDVDGDDFLIWQSQFGNSGGAGSGRGVPEPTSLLCLVAVVAAAAGTRCRPTRRG